MLSGHRSSLGFSLFCQSRNCNGRRQNQTINKLRRANTTQETNNTNNQLRGQQPTYLPTYLHLPVVMNAILKISIQL